MLQLENNENTNVVERIQSVHALKDKYYLEVISALKKSILQDEFYGVSIEAANVLGEFKEDNDYVKSNNEYIAIKDCLETRRKQLHPKIRRALLSNLADLEIDDQKYYSEYIPSIKRMVQSYKDNPTKIFNEFDFWKKVVKILIDIGWSPKYAQDKVHADCMKVALYNMSNIG